jgi:hypothetical protein
MPALPTGSMHLSLTGQCYVWILRARESCAPSLQHASNQRDAEAALTRTLSLFRTTTAYCSPPTLSALSAQGRQSEPKCKGRTGFDSCSGPTFAPPLGRPCVLGTSRSAPLSRRDRKRPPRDKIAVLATASWSTRHGCEFWLPLAYD